MSENITEHSDVYICCLTSVWQPQTSRTETKCNWPQPKNVKLPGFFLKHKKRKAEANTTKDTFAFDLSQKKQALSLGHYLDKEYFKKKI
jgi:hypothetical protein